MLPSRAKLWTCGVPAERAETFSLFPLSPSPPLGPIQRMLSQELQENNKKREN
jgi:hypothetical protein